MKRLRLFRNALPVLLLLIFSNVTYAHNHPYETKPQKCRVNDTTTVLCIGNSFTYFFDTYNVMAEIAWSQGHFMKTKAVFVSGYSFACHLADPRTHKAIENWRGYQVVLLQNQSALNARYAADPERFNLALEDTKELVARVRMYSPDARIFLESTWATKKTCRFMSEDGKIGKNTFDEFDKLMWKGTCDMSAANNLTASPIGQAFAIVRKENPNIKILFTDNHHQSLEGSYLKACVNYLMIFGGTFSKKTSTCGLDPEVAKTLQNAAARAVSQVTATH